MHGAGPAESHPAAKLRPGQAQRRFPQDPEQRGRRIDVKLDWFSIHKKIRHVCSPTAIVKTEPWVFRIGWNYRASGYWVRAKSQGVVFRSVQQIDGGGGGSRTPVRKALRTEAYMLISIRCAARPVRVCRAFARHAQNEQE